MKRLFAFGCSFTQYTWPTWADFLGSEFNQFENWGYPGIGNRAISERVAQCHAINKFTSDDIIIVQWSSYLRNDYHTGRRRLNYMKKDPLAWQGGWKTGGSMFNYINQPVYDQKWIAQFFDGQSFFMHTLNNIVATQGLLESTGCTWLMTSMSDLPKLGNDILNDSYGDALTLENPDYTIWEDPEYEKFLFYKDAIWGKYAEHWLDPIGPHAWKQDMLSWAFESDDGKSLRDMHPSPRQHISYINRVIKPKLDLPINDTPYSDLLGLVEEVKHRNSKLENFEVELIQKWHPLDYKGI